jgi:hypothetical protein
MEQLARPSNRPVPISAMAGLTAQNSLYILAIVFHISSEWIEFSEFPEFSMRVKMHAKHKTQFI